MSCFTTHKKRKLGLVSHESVAAYFGSRVSRLSSGAETRAARLGLVRVVCERSFRRPWFVIELGVLLGCSSNPRSTMASNMTTKDFFAKGTPKQFEFALSHYDKALRLKAESKSSKPENVIKLDKW